MTNDRTRHEPAWFDVSTPNPDRTQRFYRSLFDWQITQVDDTYALVTDAGGRQIGGMGKAGSESPYVGATTYFSVADVTATLEQARSLGGTSLFGPVQTPMGHIGAFLDPDGNRIGVVGA
ncbi:MAG: VOC family protein [Microbacterium sp.]|uniref:VOC family protein n=1 Tax=Microbacterium sp. TaxID=51671 RepID=UPI001AC7C89A|nr:VOC family protein [Microbacterium sp.]MBN9176967.1 VOC family protein [Microbacterium sp.]